MFSLQYEGKWNFATLAALLIFLHQNQGGILTKTGVMNPHISLLVDNETKLVISILDPRSKLLPPEARLDSDESFQLSRSFCFDLYQKREKYYEENYTTKWTQKILLFVTSPDVIGRKAVSWLCYDVL